MKRLTFILVIVGLIFHFEYGYSQEKKWTLSECIDYAVTHNIEVKQSDNQIQNLKVEKNTLKKQFPTGFECRCFAELYIRAFSESE